MVVIKESGIITGGIIVKAISKREEKGENRNYTFFKLRYNTKVAVAA